jgi:branched-chain amino acid transport system permease protein
MIHSLPLASGVEVAQQTLNVFALGSVYALLAIGVAAVFSVLGLANFAHGELVTLCGFTMLGLHAIGMPWPLIVPLTMLAGGVAAVGMEFVAFRPLRRASPSALLLSTLGLSIVIQNILLVSFGGRPKSVGIGDWSNASLHVHGLVVQWFDVATILTTIVALVALNSFLRKSVYGLAMRSASEDFTMTRLMGIRAGIVISLVFFVSGLLAGIAAFFYVGTLGQIEYDYGFNPLLKGFIAAVIGGLGSLSGAVVGGFVLAALEIIFQVSLPAAKTPFSSAIVFGLVICVLVVRPKGLFAGRGLLVDRV